MKEPVYECLLCGRTLERSEQGRYTHCRTCRMYWDSAFMMGFQHAKNMLSANSIVEMKQLMEEASPYKVRE